MSTPRIARRAPHRSRVSTLPPLLMLGWLAACGGETAVSPDTTAGKPASIASAGTTAVSLTSVGASSQIDIVLRDARGAVIPSAPVGWSSSDITVADVMGAGSSAVVTARAPGRATILASIGALTQEFTVNVLGARALSIAPTDTTIRSGDRIAMRPVIDAETGARVEVRFSAGDPAIASVSSTGDVVGLSPGIALVKAVVVGDPRVTATALVRVTTPRTVRIESSNVTTWVGDRSQLRASIEVDSTESREIAWTSDNATIATVTSSGQVVGVGAGVARIRASAVIDPRATDSVDVQVLPERRVVVSPAATSLGAGQTRALTATVSIEAGLSRAVTWRSDNPSIAMVSSDGMVTAIAQGQTTVTAIAVADTVRRGTAVIQVVPIVRDFDLQPSAASIFIGDTRQLGATITVDAGGTNGISWRSSNAAVATVSSAGLVLGTGPGTAIITAVSLQDSTRQATSLITVRNAPVVDVQPGALTINPADVRTLVATVRADAGLSTAVIWRTGNPQIATVDGTGRLTGVASGTTIIEALAVADTTRRGRAIITVVPGVRAVAITPSTVSLAPTETRALAATITGDPGVSQAVIWRSSNAAVASVSSDGIVTGVSVGTTSITAIASADTTKRASIPLSVRSAPVVTVSPSSIDLQTGMSRQVTASVRTDAGVSAAVSWSSNNPSVATVSTAGLITAVGVGTTTVIARSDEDPSRSATVTVTVTPGVRSVAITPSALSVAPSETRALSASVIGDPGVSQAVIWRSGNAAVASISSSGIVSGVSIGTTSITAIASADTTKRASMTITVRSAPIVTVSPSNIDLQTGTSRQVTASVRTDAGVSAAVSWSSTNPSVATVSSAGLITAVGIGTTSVIARSDEDPSRTATVTVTVTPRILSVGVSPSALSLQTGNLAQLSPVVFAEGNLSTAVTWRSSNPAVASVNFLGVVSAISAGSATITVLSQVDTLIRATATVVVSTTPTRVANSWSAARQGGSLYEDVVSLSAVDNVTAYAVNSIGDVYRYTGSTWQLSASGSTYGTRFLSVAGVSGGTAVAVGTNGTIIRFNGSNWSTMASGTSQTLNDVWLESASSGYAVGANGTALVFNGSWSATSTGSTQTLNSVWSTGGVAFAVGTAGEMLRWTGGAWTRFAPITSETLYGVSGGSTSNIVAVGSFGTVLQFNGSTWSKLSTSETSDLYSVATNGSSGISTIGGDRGLLQLSGATLSTVATPYAPRLFSVSLDNSNAVWTSGQRGAIMRQSGSWQTLNLAPDLIDVWSSSSSNAWAVGEFGFTYRWNGSSWSRVATPATTTLNAVWSPNSSDAFAGGDNGTMLRWNGASWSAMTFPSTASVYGLWGSSSTNVYAVTSTGQVLRFNGSSWSIVASASNALWAIHGASANDIVATGENGTGLRFDGASWTSFNAPTTGTLAGVWSGASTYFSVGANANGVGGLTFASSGSGWTGVSTGSARVLTSIWGLASNDLYATGEQGTILRYNGTGWTTMPTGTSDLLWSVSAGADGLAGFAVGYNSTIVTANPAGGAVAAGRVLTNRASELNPLPGARLTRGALPTGVSRGNRKLRKL